jgi:hypothetical protein
LGKPSAHATFDSKSINGVRTGVSLPVVLLEGCSNDARHDRETQWISKFPNLLNERKMGHCRRDCKPQATPADETLPAWVELTLH